jgi:hypothetical protein
MQWWARRRNLVLQVQKDMQKMQPSYATQGYPNRTNFVITIATPKRQEQ